MTNYSNYAPYRSARTLSYVAIVCLGGIALCGFLYVILSLAVLLLPNAQMNTGDGESVSIPWLFIGLFSILENILRLGAVISFLLWEYRAFTNLAALKAEDTEFSPGWAVGWWFIPFANLIKPYQAIRELWQQSDSEFEDNGSFLSSVGSTPPLLGYWWALFIISNVLNRFLSSVSNGVEIETDSLFPYLMIIASAFLCAAAVAAVIVKKITDRQENRLKKIAAVVHKVPPPPDFSQQEQQ